MRPESACGSFKFHRTCAADLALQLGNSPELEDWFRVFRGFLCEKSSDMPDEFKWPSCWMLPSGIEWVLKAATYQFGMEQLALE